MLALGKFLWCLTILVLLPFNMAGKKELEAVVQGNGEFTKQLYNVLASESGKNVFFSPISAHAVLSLAYQGAKGTTEEAFAKTLNVPNKEVAATGYSDVLSNLNNVSDVQLLMANKIYIMTGYNLQDNFKEVAEKKFLSAIEPVNFAENVAAAGKINAWVEEKTKEKIKDLIKPSYLDALTRLVLVNAIYFKGSWAQKFDPKLTKTEKFYLNDEDSVDVQMMNIKGKYLYKEDGELDAKVLELPYSNPDVSLIVVLPNKRNGIAELEQKLQNTDLTKITENMYKPEVVVKMPKFKTEVTIELDDALRQMGLGVIFTEKANFTGMLQEPEPLCVSKVIQKAFIEVNEEGTEAAAATGMIFLKKSGGRRIKHELKEFYARHPFIFLLSYKKEAVLFKGRIAAQP